VLVIAVIVAVLVGRRKKTSPMLDQVLQPQLMPGQVRPAGSQLMPGEVGSADQRVSFVNPTMSMPGSLAQHENRNISSAGATANTQATQPRPEASTEKDLNTLLEFAQLTHFAAALTSLGVVEVADLQDVDDSEFSELGMSLADVKQLKDAIEGKPPDAAADPLQLLLASAQLTQFTASLKSLGVVEVADLQDVDDSEFSELGMSLADVKQLKDAIEGKPPDAAADPLQLLLASAQLTQFTASLKSLGVVEIADLVDLTDADYIELGMSAAQMQKLQIAARPQSENRVF
jgi:hypothetical protein